MLGSLDRGRAAPGGRAHGGGVLGLHVLGFGCSCSPWRRRTAYRLGGAAVFAGRARRLTAYTLGMRHAFDADHISAIDNTTRKLMADGKRPLSVGLLLLARTLDDRVRARAPVRGRACGR